MANPALLTTRDGDYNAPDSSDNNYYEWFDEWPGLTVWHQPIVMDVDAISVPAIGSEGSGAYAAYYFWKDTPWRGLGGNVVAFERLWHNLPGDADRKVSVTKNYQVAQYTFKDGVTVDLNIISFSRAIKANCHYHYALDDPGSLPVVPILMIIPFLLTRLMTDLGTGFPTANFNGQQLFNNNYASSTLDGASITHIFGHLLCRKVLTG